MSKVTPDKNGFKYARIVANGEIRDLNEVHPVHGLDSLVPENQRVVIQVEMEQMEVDKAIQAMMRRFFANDARPPVVQKTTRRMGDRTARFWLRVINGCNRLLRHVPYRYLGPLNFWIDDWGQRSGLWAALIRMKPKPESVEGGGGYIMPDEFVKDFFFHYDFMRYWRREGQDLRALIQRLEAWQQK